MKAWTHSALLLILVAAACTSASTEPPTPTDPTPADVSPTPGTGRLELAVTRQCCYIEGSIFHIWIRTEAGDVVLEETFDAEARTFVIQRDLEPGTYSIETYERPCQPVCTPGGALDPPTSRCERTLVIEAGESYRLPVETGPEILGCPS